MKLIKAIAGVMLPAIALPLLIALPFLAPMGVALFFSWVASLHPILTWIFNPITLWVIVAIVTFAPFVVIEYFKD